MSGQTLQLYCAGELRNLGDALIAETLVRRFRDDSFQRIEVLSWTAPSSAMQEYFGAAGAVAVGLKGRIWKNLIAAKGAQVVLAGGNAVRDTVGFRWLLQMIGVVTIASLTGGGATALGVGVASHRLSWWKQRFWGLLLGVMETISVRDRESLDRMTRRWPALAARMRLSADVVYGMEGKAARAEASPNSARLLVAPASDAMESRRVQSEHLSQLAVQLARRHGATEILVVAHDVELDMKTCEELVSRIRGEGTVPVRQIHVATPASLADLYQPGTLVLSSRLHALILGTMAAAPVVVVFDGDIKIAPFAADCGAPTLTLEQGEGPDLDAAYASAVASVRSGKQAESVSEMRRRALTDCLPARCPSEPRVKDGAQP